MQIVTEVERGGDCDKDNAFFLAGGGVVTSQDAEAYRVSAKATESLSHALDY